jgi:hypothetical protein
MSDNRPNWHHFIAGEVAQEEVLDTIALIDELLEEDVEEVVRSYVSDLILNVRSLRDSTQRIQEGCDPQVLATVVCHKLTRDGDHGITLGEYVQTSMETIQELKQRLHDLQFYAMALAERRKAAAEATNTAE